MRLAPLLLAVAALLAPGCLQDAPAAGPREDAPPAEPVESSGTTEPFGVVVRFESTDVTEMDLLCASGGGIRIEREPGVRIGPNVTTLRVTLATGPANTGIQLGYRVDDGDVAWLPPHRGDAKTIEVPVPGDQRETDGERWEFWYQQDIPESPRGCYTGFGKGARSIVVEAVVPP